MRRPAVVSKISLGCYKQPSVRKQPQISIKVKNHRSGGSESVQLLSAICVRRLDSATSSPQTATLKHDCSTATLGGFRDLTTSSGNQNATATDNIYASDSSDTASNSRGKSSRLSSLEKEVTPMMFCQVTESWKDIRAVSELM